MAQLLDIFGFLAVLLRALTLAFSAITIGGVVFRYLVIRAASSIGNPTFDSGTRLLRVAAYGLSFTQLFYLLANSAILSGTTGMRFSEQVGASYFVWGCLGSMAALALAVLAKWPNAVGRADIPCSLIILASTVATSHSAARLDHQFILLLATAAHQTATAAWIGGLPFLLLALAAMNEATHAYTLCLRFSAIASASVAILFGAGIVLAYFYVGSFDALYGTTYGVMLVSKLVLFATILFFGAFNFKIVRQLRNGNQSMLVRLRRFGEAEIGIGITAILAAASLTSQPPGVDLVNNRMSTSTIAARMRPRWPRMTTPPLSTLSPSQREIWKKQHPVTGNS